MAGTDPRGLDPHLPRIRRATERLTDVVDNVLTRGRPQGAADTLRPVPLRLDQLVEQVCEELTAGPHTLTASLEPSVATADGGALTADTRPGGGSVFRLVLGPREARRARGRSTVPVNGPVS
ncbi:hypothetical protein [Streptomyces sp. NPDC093093]|uniref:hypothetical protein n=1 Tax=Streptomyces sp. NPDC093093 TaxID=3366025 RepID=UPI00381F4564